MQTRNRRNVLLLLVVPGAAEDERRDELREGLASYTGIAAWADSAAR